MVQGGMQSCERVQTVGGSQYTSALPQLATQRATQPPSPSQDETTHTRSAPHVSHAIGSHESPTLSVAAAVGELDTGVYVEREGPRALQIRPAGQNKKGGENPTS
jgi:hypothetical protein